jgi:hypothetical protein
LSEEATMLARLAGLGLVLALAAGAHAQPAAKLDAATQAKIRKLQSERRDELRKAVRFRAFQVKAGEGTPQAVIMAAQALLEAELELASSAAERVTAHAVHLEVARYVEKITETFFKAGVVQRAENHLARAARLKAEVGWLKAGGKDTKKETEKARKWLESLDPFGRKADKKE